MAKYNSLKALFVAIADAIRAKTGGADTIKAEDFPMAIEGISGGGCGYETPHTFIYEGKTYLFLPGQAWYEWFNCKGGNNDQGGDFVVFYNTITAWWHIGADEYENDIANTLIYPDTGIAVGDSDIIQAIEYGTDTYYEDL